MAIGKHIGHLGLGLLLALTVSAAPADGLAADRDAREMSAKELFARAAPAVVKVLLYDPVGNRFGSGSGFLVDPSGLVVTNYHVIAPAGTVSNIRIKLAGKMRAIKGLCGSAPKHDLALLAMETRPGEKLPHLPLARKVPAQGEKAYAIGYPLGLPKATITDGLINGIQKIHGMDLLQTSTPISRGSSGGPLLIADGTVVGASSGSLVEGQNLNFAVPVEAIRAMLTAAGKPQRAVPPLAGPATSTALPRTDQPVNLRTPVDLKDRTIPMTVRRLYAGMVQQFLAMGLARPGLGETQQKKRFAEYIQRLCGQDIIGRRITCRVRVVSLTRGRNRVRQIQFLRRQVPRSNPPEHLREYGRLLRDAAPYSVLAVCRSPYWPQNVYAYLHRDHAARLARDKPPGPAGLSGFISQWVANAPPGKRLELSVTLDACTLADRRVSADDSEARAKLNLAKVYIDAQMPDRAAGTLELIVRRYAGTAAAKEAKSILARLQRAGGPRR